MTRRREGTKGRLTARRLLWWSLLAVYLLASTVAAVLRRDAASGAALMGIVFFPAFLILVCVDNLIVVYGRRKGGYAEGMGWFYLIGVSVFSVLLWSMMWLTFPAARGSSEEEECRANLRQLAQALQMYAGHHDGILPPADRWSDLLLPYVEDPKAFICPAAPKLRSGYAYNRALAGRRLSDLTDTRQLIAIHESDRGWNAAGGPELLTREPRHGIRDKIVDLYGTVAGGTAQRVRLSAVSPEERHLYAQDPAPPSLQWQPKTPTPHTPTTSAPASPLR